MFEERDFSNGADIANILPHQERFSFSRPQIVKFLAAAREGLGKATEAKEVLILVATFR